MLLRVQQGNLGHVGKHLLFDGSFKDPANNGRKIDGSEYVWLCWLLLKRGQRWRGTSNQETIVRFGGTGFIVYGLWERAHQGRLVYLG